MALSRASRQTLNRKWVNECGAQVSYIRVVNFFTNFFTIFVLHATEGRGVSIEAASTLPTLSTLPLCTITPSSPQSRIYTESGLVYQLLAHD